MSKGPNTLSSVKPVTTVGFSMVTHSYSTEPSASEVDQK
jgi:hypothetical protein